MPEEKNKLVPSDKEITCVKNHLAVYGYFAKQQNIADRALPCEICRYFKMCDHRHADHIAWVFGLNEDKRSMGDIGKYVTNKQETGYALPSTRQTARIVAQCESDISSLLLRNNWILLDVEPTSDGSGRFVYYFSKEAFKQQGQN